MATRKSTTSYVLQAALLFQFVFLTVTAQDNDSNDNLASNRAKSIFDSIDGVKVGGAILAVVSILAGVLVCFAGYKFIKPAMFVIGFALGGVIIAMIFEEIFKNKSYVVTASWIAFIVGGLIVGLAVVAFYSLSIFLVGATGGVLLASLINTSFGYKLYESHPWVILIILAIILGVIGGVLALKLERPVIIMATAFIGAAMIIWGIGYFAGNFPSARDWVYDIPNAWWGYLVAIFILAAIGAFVQFRKTSLGITHTRETHKKNRGMRWTSHAVPSRHATAAQQSDDTLTYAEVHTPTEANTRFGNPITNV